MDHCYCTCSARGCYKIVTGVCYLLKNDFDFNQFSPLLNPSFYPHLSSLYETCGGNFVFCVSVPTPAPSHTWTSLLQTYPISLSLAQLTPTSLWEASGGNTKQWPLLPPHISSLITSSGISDSAPRPHHHHNHFPPSPHHLVQPLPCHIYRISAIFLLSSALTKYVQRFLFSWLRKWISTFFCNVGNIWALFIE